MNDQSNKPDNKEEEKDDVLEEAAEDVAENSIAEDLDELGKLKQDYKELDNRFKRALADYQNLEKRVSEGRVELASWATSNLMQKLLPVMDHFDKAMIGVTDEEKKSGWFKGVQMSVQQLQNVLKDEGLEQIEADGQFDPTLHEAVDTIDGEHDKIMSVVEKGYRLGGKVIKPARVVVGRKENRE